MSGTDKKSAAINFRVPVTFREKVEALVGDIGGGWDITKVLWTGLVGFWPEIEAMVRMAGPTPPPDDSALLELKQIAVLCRRAQDLGINPAGVLLTAVETKLAVDCAQRNGTHGD